MVFFPAEIRNKGFHYEAVYTDEYGPTYSDNEGEAPLSVLLFTDITSSLGVIQADLTIKDPPFISIFLYLCYHIHIFRAIHKFIVK